MYKQLSKDEFLALSEHLLMEAYEDVMRCEGSFAGDKFLQNTLTQHEKIEDYDMCIIIRDLIAKIEVTKMLLNVLKPQP